MTMMVRRQRQKVRLVTTGIWVATLLGILLLLAIGFVEGYQVGRTSGIESGYHAGILSNQQVMYTLGYRDGTIDGQIDGYHKGYQDGRIDGVQAGIIQEECFIARQHPQANTLLGYTC